MFLQTCKNIATYASCAFANDDATTMMQSIYLLRDYWTRFDSRSSASRWDNSQSISMLSARIPLLQSTISAQ